MSPARLWTITTIFLVIIIVAMGLGIRKRKIKDEEQQAQAVALDSGATRGCADEEQLPARVLADHESASIIITGDPGITATIDGELIVSTLASPKRVRAGVHKLEVKKSGYVPSTFDIRVTPFQPGLIDARVDGPAITVHLHQVGCASCSRPSGDVVLMQKKTTNPRALDEAARALAVADWKNAAEILREADRAARSTARFPRQVIMVLTFSGAPTRAEEGLKHTETVVASEMIKNIRALKKLEAIEQEQRSQLALERWNTITERFARLVENLVHDAPGSVTNPGARMNELSQGFSKAKLSNDVLEQEAIVETAFTVFRGLVRDLRSMHPKDCAWQARITANQ